MNNWNCQRCNFTNPAADRFCKNCGTPATNTVQSAQDLPPTVIGMSPPFVPNQQNFAPNQPAQTPPPQFPPQMPQPQYQPQQYQPQPQFAPNKSNGKKFALIGGIGGLIVISAIGIVLWVTVINPYLTEQARLKKESENQTRANSTTAISLLPEEYNTNAGGISQTFRKNKTIDRMQLLQASQNLPPEMQSELKDINDAAAAEYVSTKDGSQKVLLQIFKYNTPAQAVSNCDKVGRELQKNQALLKEVIYVPANAYVPTNCYTYAEDKNKGFTGISTLYGFLLIYSGHKDNDPAAVRTSVFNKLTQ